MKKVVLSKKLKLHFEHLTTLRLRELAILTSAHISQMIPTSAAAAAAAAVDKPTTSDFL
jgi:hypothetical protein